MVDIGFTTDDIMKRLDFPTPRKRVEEAVFQRLTETGILLEELPVRPGDLRVIRPGQGGAPGLAPLLRSALERDGEEHSYVSCPFGTIRRDREVRLRQMLSCLTSRERDYLLGIPWRPKVMYHRLNSRMYEISLCLAEHGTADLDFYFLKSGLRLTCRDGGRTEEPPERGDRRTAADKTGMI